MESRAAKIVNKHRYKSCERVVEIPSKPMSAFEMDPWLFPPQDKQKFLSSAQLDWQSEVKK
jgi:hypothetical protein